MSSLLVILGNGPSLKGFDFKRLAPFDAIGMNAAYRYWYEIGWFPRYYICLDKVVGVSHKDQIAKLIRESDSNGIELFLLRRNLIALFDESLQKSDRVLDFDTLRANVDLFDPVPFTTGSHAALFGSLLGYRQMLLMGIDCNYVEKVAGARQQGGVLEIVEPSRDNPNYFFEGYQAAGDRYNIPNPAPEMHIESWRAVAPSLVEKGVEVWNGSPISRLTAFPFRSYDDVEAALAADARRPAGGAVGLPSYARFRNVPSEPAETADAPASSSLAARFRPSSLPVHIANWAQRHDAPAILTLGKFAMWCAGVASRKKEAVGTAALAILILAVGGLISTEWRGLLWTLVAGLVLAGAVTAAVGFMRRSHRRHAATLELALAFAERRATAGKKLDRVRKDGSGENTSLAATATCVWSARAILGEGSCWDARSRKVYWTDIKGKRLHALNVADATRQTWDLPFRIGSVGIPPPGWQPPAELGGAVLVAAGDPGLMWLALDSEGVSSVTIVHPETHLPENRFNDGKFGPDGRYWAGTIHDAETRASGHLYAFSPEGGYALMDGGYCVTNGPAFSPDGKTVYHTDSALQTIYALDLTPDGQLAHKRVLARFEAGEGYPDGMTVDGEGNLWIAMWDGSRIQKLSPEGRRMESVRLPTSRPTSCVFVDDGCKVMYVTTAAIGLTAEDDLAGGLFRIEFGD